MAILDSVVIVVLEVTERSSKRSRQTHLLSHLQVVPTVLILPTSLEVVLSEEGSVQGQCILGVVEREHQVVEETQPESRSSYRLFA